MEFIVYILFSETKNRFILVILLIWKRELFDIIKKSKGFTGNTKDWRVVYVEKYKTKELAQQRELQIKSWKSRIKIQELISKKN